jgi:hypothetical protein
VETTIPVFPGVARDIAISPDGSDAFDGTLVRDWTPGSTVANIVSDITDH